VAPDAKSLFGDAIDFQKPGWKARRAKIKNLRQAERYLPDNIYTANRKLPQGDGNADLMGEMSKAATRI